MNTQTTATDLVQRVWLTTAEAATYTGRHTKTVQIAAADGSLESAQHTRGGRRRFRKEWLDAWVTGAGRRRVS